MRKTISEQWLRSEDACKEGIKWWKKHGSKSVDITLRRIHVKPDYAKWLIERLLEEDKRMAVQLAIYSAKSCIGKYNRDKTTLLNSISAAEAVLANDCPETRSAARSAVSSTVSSTASSVASIAAMYAARSAASSVASIAAMYAAMSAAMSAASSAAWQDILSELIRLRKESVAC